MSGWSPTRLARGALAWTWAWRKAFLVLWVVTTPVWLPSTVTLVRELWTARGSYNECLDLIAHHKLKPGDHHVAPTKDGLDDCYTEVKVWWPVHAWSETVRKRWECEDESCQSVLSVVWAQLRDLGAAATSTFKFTLVVAGVVSGAAFVGFMLTRTRGQLNTHRDLTSLPTTTRALPSTARALPSSGTRGISRRPLRIPGRAR